jgi:hypothetical protein
MRPSAAPTKASDTRTPPAPHTPPPPGRLVREGAAPPLSVEILCAVIFFVGLLLSQLYAPPAPVHVHTSAQLSCERPAEYETLLVYVNADPDGAVSVSCGPKVSGPLRR